MRNPYIALLALIMRSFLVLLTFAPFIAVAQTGFDGNLDNLDGIGRSIVAAKCANPLSTFEEKIQNRHVDGVVDLIRKIQCNDYSLQFYIANAFKPSHELPMRLNIRKQQRLLPPNMNIGATELQIRASLGTPENALDGKLVYVAGEDGADTITFVTKGGYVVEIDWSWDVD